MLTSEVTPFAFASPQTKVIDQDVSVLSFLADDDVVYVNGKLNGTLGNDVYFQFGAGVNGELDVSSAISIGTPGDLFIRVVRSGDEVGFIGDGALNDSQLRVLFRSINGATIGLPHPGVENGVTNSAIIAAAMTGWVVSSGSGPIFASNLGDIGNYVLLPVRDGVAGLATAISEDGAFVFGEDGAGHGPSVIWRRDVHSQSGAAFYTKLQIGAPDIGSPNSLTRSITNDFFPLEYVDIDFETFDFTQYVGLWRSSDATFVRGFENRRDPYIAKYDDVNYLLYSGPDPLSAGQDMLYLYVDGADDAVPLRDFYATRNVSLASPELGEIAKVIEFSFASTGELLILGESYKPGSDELVTTFSIFPAFNLAPTAEFVSLTSDASDYELTVENGRVIVRAVAGGDLFSRAVGAVSALTITGTDSAERLRVVGDVSAAEIPLTVLAGAGDDVLDFADWPGPIVVDAGTGNDSVDASRVGAAVSLDGGDGDDQLWGGSADDFLSGSSGSDTIMGRAGNDVLIGGQGDDSFEISDLTFQRVAGGSGSDTLRLDGGGLTLDLTAIADNKLTDIEVIDLTGSGNNTLTLNPLEVLTVSSASNTLLVRRDAGDTVNRGPGWTQSAYETIGSDTFAVFTQGAATLKVEADPSPISVAVTAGQLRIDDISGGAVDVLVSFNAVSSEFVIGARTGGFVSHEFRVPSATVTAGLRASLGDGNDKLDLSGISLPSTVLAGTGNDSITSGIGRDSLVGDDGDDTLNAGSGNDTVLAGAGRDSVTGGAGADSISGGEGVDVVFGGTGNDTIDGGLGNDVISGQDGDDSILGGADNDKLTGAAGNDVIDGGIGDDVLDGSAGNDVLFGREGDDLLTGGDGLDRLEGGAGADRMRGEKGLDTLLGGAGADNLSGGADNDSLDGGDDNDALFGDFGNDTVLGGAGDDLLRGFEGADVIDGGAGTNDRYSEEGETNYLVVGMQISSVLFGTETPLNVERLLLNGGAGNNLIDARQSSVKVILNGLGGNDTLLGGAFIDNIFGGDGDDVLSGGESNDAIDGGAGTEFFYEKANANVTITGLTVVSTGISPSVGTGTETLVGIETIALVGGDSANTLNAASSSVPVILLGGKGDDTLIGSNFDDVLVGGLRADSAAGTDSLTGGLGADTFDNDAADNVTRVTDGTDSVIANVFATPFPSWLDLI